MPAELADEVLAAAGLRQVGWNGAGVAADREPVGPGAVRAARRRPWPRRGSPVEPEPDRARRRGELDVRGRSSSPTVRPAVDVEPLARAPRRRRRAGARSGRSAEWPGPCPSSPRSRPSRSSPSGACTTPPYAPQRLLRPASASWRRAASGGVDEGARRSAGCDTMSDSVKPRKPVVGASEAPGAAAARRARRRRRRSCSAAAGSATSRVTRVDGSHAATLTSAPAAGASRFLLAPAGPRKAASFGEAPAAKPALP